MSPRALTVLSFLPCAALASQSPVGKSRHVTWPPPGPAIYTHTAAGFLDGDLLRDVAVLLDGKIHIAHSPSLFTAHATNIAEAVDFGVFEADGQGARDSLVAVNSSGLVKIDWSSTAPHWNEALLVSSWASALSIDQHPSADGPTEVVGLMNGGLELRRWKRVDGVYRDEHLFYLLNRGEEILYFDRDGLEDDEIAVRTATGLDIYDVHGTRVDFYDAPSSRSISIARVQQSGTDEEWVAWLAEDPAGNQYLITMGTDGVVVHITLGQASGVAISSGDANNDGSSDLVLSQQLTHHIVLFDNFGTGAPQYSLAEPDKYHLILAGPAGTAAPMNEASAVLADLDNDEDLDFCFPVQSQGALWFGSGTLLPEAAYLPQITFTDETMNGAFLQREDGRYLEFEFTVPWPLPGHTSDVEITLFEKAAIGTSTTSTAVRQIFVPLSSGTLSQDETALQLSASLMIDESTETGDLNFEELYFFLMRQVRMSEGVVVGVLPAQVYGFQGSETPGNDAYLAGLSPNGATSTVPFEGPEDEPGEDDGSISCPPCIPDFSDDDPPAPPFGGQ